jgi:hypothetical protein
MILLEGVGERGRMHQLCRSVEDADERQRILAAMAPSLVWNRYPVESSDVRLACIEAGVG